MFKKLASVVLITAVVCTLGGTSAFANNPSNPDAKTDTANVPSEAATKKEVKRNEQLKNSMLKLVADAKAGKVLSAAKSQIQPAKSNNWSKGTKIAVGVAIAVAVIAVIVVVAGKNTPGRVL
ncbi:hypothetical protein BH18ACI4_BH18ACI4_15490 [soil metagenome]